MRKMFKTDEAGFTLIEMLIVVLIVGILAAIAAPVYFGYAKDAKTSEAKAIVGSLWTSLQGCAQASAGNACVVKGQYARAGLSSAGATADARWTASTTAEDNTMTMSATTNKLSASASPLMQLDGVTGKDTDGLKVQFSWDNTALTGSFKCDTGSGFNPC